MKIKIPIGLADVIADYRWQQQAAVCALLHLKQVSEDNKYHGKIKAPVYRPGRKPDKTALKHAAEDISIGLRSLERYIKILIEMGLITKDHGYYKFSSWETIQERFRLANSDRFYHVLYDPVLIAQANVGYSLVYELQRIAAEEILNDCAFAINANLQFKPEFKSELRTVTPSGTINRESVFHTQLVNFLNPSKYLTASERETLQEKRFDTACSTLRYNALYDYRSRGGMAYKKRRWVEMGMAVIRNRSRRLDPRSFPTRSEREACKYGKIVWMDIEATPSIWRNVADENRVAAVKRELWLIMPDEIYFIKPKDRQWMKAPPVALAA